MTSAMTRLTTSASASSLSQLLFIVLTTVLTKGFYPQIVRKLELVVLTLVRHCLLAFIYESPQFRISSKDQTLGMKGLTDLSLAKFCSIYSFTPPI